jgi:predicted permease
MSEVRDALRTLRGNPFVTMLALFSLALAIGANTAIFSILNALMLRPLPSPDADRLVMLTAAEDDWFSSAWTNPIWESIRSRGGLHDGAFAFRTTGFNLADRGVVDPVEGLQASGEIFEVLGIEPILGRTFGAADDRRDGGPDGPVAVLSYDFWKQRYGGAQDVIGRTIRLNRVPFTIIGVTPAEFFGPDVGRRFDVAVPLNTVAILNGGPGPLDSRSSWWLRVMIRLPRGQAVEAAMANLRAAQAQIAEETRPTDGAGNDAADHLSRPFVLVPAATGSSELRATYQTPVVTLMAIVALTLLIACANIANLMLARSAARRHEFSLRAALGASRFRLARTLITESVLLAALGAALGALFAWWGSRLLLAQLSTARRPVYLDAGLDWRLLVFTVVVTAATALLFGTVPALRAARAAPMEAMKERGRSASSTRGAGIAGSLVVMQFALSFVLLLGASLFVRTFQSLINLDTGFELDRALLVHMGAPGAGVPADARGPMYDRILDEVRALPGISAAGLSLITPLMGSNTTRIMEFPERPDLAEADRRVWLNIISPGWIEALGMNVVAGRILDERDQLAAPRSVIVNETFAATYFSGSNPIGKVIRQSAGPGSDPAPLHIIGVVADAVYRSLREPVPPTMYWAVAQQRVIPAGLSLVVRPATGSDPSIARNLIEAVSSVNPDLTLAIGTLEEEVSGILAQERLLATIAGFFGALALLLAGIGLFGVTSHSVTQRRAEIGVRMALGATQADAIRLVLARVAALMAFGVTLGGILGYWASSIVGGLVFGLAAHDPVANLSALVVLVGTGVLAAVVPSWRATRFHPAEVVRLG